MHLQNLPKRLFQILTSYNIINKSVLYKKFCSLETLWQFLANRLLDHTRSRKTDQCPRFRKNNVSQHRKTCRHSTGRRLSQNTDIKKPCFTVAFKCRGRFCHLHQRCDSLLHSGSTGTGKNNDRKFLLSRAFYRSRDFFSDSPAHARHQESSITDSHYGFPSVNFSFSRDNCLFQPTLCLKSIHLFRISLIIHRIFTDQVMIPFLKGSLIQHHLDSAICMNTKISATFRTGIMILFDIFCDDRCTAFVALTKKSFRHFRSGSACCIMALYSGNNSCLFEHVIQFHNRQFASIRSINSTSVFPD